MACRPVQELVEQGRARLRAGDAAGARQILEEALADVTCGDVGTPDCRSAPGHSNRRSFTGIGRKRNADSWTA